MKKFIIGAILLVSLSTGISAAAQPINRNCPAQVRCEINNLSVKSCPGTAGKTVGTCKKGQLLKCLGKLGNYYVVQMPNDTIGVVSNVYCEPSYTR